MVRLTFIDTHTLKGTTMARNTSTNTKVNTKAATAANVKAPKTEGPKSMSADGKELEPIATVDLSACTNWSQKMRLLASLNYTTADIARHLGKKYQHVRNVLIQPAPQSNEPAAS